MIELTAEMVSAAYAACDDPATEVEELDLRRMLTAVLAIVERDYHVELCGMPVTEWLALPYADRKRRLQAAKKGTDRG